MDGQRSREDARLRVLRSVAGDAGLSRGGNTPMAAGIAQTGSRAAMVSDARKMLAAGDLAGAWAVVSKLLSKKKTDAEAHYLAAMVAERTYEWDIARHHANLSLREIDHPDTHMLISRLDRAAGATDAAIQACDRALKHRPGEYSFLVHKAGIFEAAGRFSEAREIVDDLLAQAKSKGQPPSLPLKYELAKLLVQEREYHNAVAVLEELTTDSAVPEPARRLQLYLAAKAHDRSGRYPEAFVAATRANEIEQLDFDPALYEQQVTELISNWSAERISRFPLAQCDDACPVFIAGMPRSGTSLIDQIIDAHPKAAGVGELTTIETFAQQLSQAYNPDKEPPACFGKYDTFRWTRVAKQYIKQIKAHSEPGVDRIVNKALGNNKLVGLLSRLFPKTRIIHALRDPRDVAISCYMGGFNNRMHAWTTRLDWAAAAWEQSRRMMDHWKQTLDVEILDVRYEDLVQDPESQFRRVIEFLGLEWDEACTRFYESKRTVRTLSYDQVNRPLYTTSVGRHTHYLPEVETVSFPDY